MCTSCCKPTAADVLTRTKTGQVMWKKGGMAEGERQGVVQTGGGGTGEKRGEGEKWRGDNRLSWKCKQSLSHTGLKVEQRKQLTHAYRGEGTPPHTCDVSHKDSDCGLQEQFILLQPTTTHTHNSARALFCPGQHWMFQQDNATGKVQESSFGGVFSLSF